MKTFKEYLDEVFAEQYHGTDDEMPEYQEKWFELLTGEEMYGYAEEFVGKLNKKIDSICNSADSFRHDLNDAEVKLIKAYDIVEKMSVLAATSNAELVKIKEMVTKLA